jgi:hypothetical protein
MQQVLQLHPPLPSNHVDWVRAWIKAIEEACSCGYAAVLEWLLDRSMGREACSRIRTERGFTELFLVEGTQRRWNPFTAPALWRLSLVHDEGCRKEPTRFPEYTRVRAHLETLRTDFSWVWRRNPQLLRFAKLWGDEHYPRKTHCSWSTNVQDDPVLSTTPWCFSFLLDDVHQEKEHRPKGMCD